MVRAVRLGSLCARHDSYGFECGMSEPPLIYLSGFRPSAHPRTENKIFSRSPRNNRHICSSSKVVSTIWDAEASTPTGMFSRGGDRKARIDVRCSHPSLWPTRVLHRVFFGFSFARTERTSLAKRSSFTVAVDRRLVTPYLTVPLTPADAFHLIPS